MDNLWGVALGGLIATVVPVATLFRDHVRWRAEKNIENLRLKHSRLERMYSELLEQLSEAFKNNSFPSKMTSKISVYASKEVRDLYFGYVMDKERDKSKLKNLYLDIYLEADRHLARIESQIDKALS
ncbi:hypothetical protein [Stenotrophomonas acidaminiphila]|uniref:hypothetical protein n=1 Tax=Stenotrophomonas acidaminiphila TaxID=128780 RepID=UPI0028A64CB8|nr:hypothetical protein [Stenotrophomonas acidaminiphila]